MMTNEISELVAAINRLATAIERGGLPQTAEAGTPAPEPTPVVAPEPVPAPKAAEPAPEPKVAEPVAPVPETAEKASEPADNVPKTAAELFGAMRPLLDKAKDRRAAQLRILERLGASSFHGLPAERYGDALKYARELVTEGY